MNELPSPDIACVDRFIQAVLYEGYILYPYRQCVKNRQRWTFGGVYPRAYCEATKGSERFAIQTECLIVGGADVRLAGNVRFLHLIQRSVGELDQAVDEWPLDREPSYTLKEILQVESETYQPWQEAVERQVPLNNWSLQDLVNCTRQQTFEYEGARQTESIRDANGEIGGVIVRESCTLRGMIEVSAVCVASDLYRVRVVVQNETLIEKGVDFSNDHTALRSMASTNIVLNIQDGQFLSLTDPPSIHRVAAEDCQNIGTWPVLVGQEGDARMLLASPIILYDYPQVAVESPGDLFDSTEIDEILNLRIMTLTDEEKRQATAIDPRASAMLNRAENLTSEQMMRLHGTVRKV